MEELEALSNTFLWAMAKTEFHLTTIPTGWKCKQEVIDFKYFLASSTKSIFIGLPHIHGVAWINRKWLENFGIHGNLIDYPEETVKLVDMVMSCSLSNESEKLNKIVSEVQIHHHTKSCRKYGTKCRFGFPKLPSKKTILAKPLPTEMDETPVNRGEIASITSNTVALIMQSSLLQICFHIWHEILPSDRPNMEKSRLRLT